MKNNAAKRYQLYKDAYILQESFAMTDESYPPPCRNYLQPFYLSVTLYACAQRGNGLMFPYRYIIDFAEARRTDDSVDWRGVTFAILFVLAGCMDTLFFSQANFGMMRLGLQIKISLIGLIYKKVNQLLSNIFFIFFYKIN